MSRYGSFSKAAVLLTVSPTIRRHQLCLIVSSQVRIHQPLLDAVDK